MPTAHSNGIELAYDTFGSPEDPTLLLVMGIGVQLLGWDERFCALLAGRGFHVVRFDNRDVGLSTKLDDAPSPDLAAALGGDASSAAYSLSDMAADAAGLLDALGVERAHVAGVSMGGMIAQLLAIEHPERVLSLTSIMSTTGDRAVGGATPEALAALFAPAGRDRDSAIERAVTGWSIIRSPGFAFDEDTIRARAAASYDRANHPVGMLRQALAIISAPDRAPALRELDVPALVIHGDRDVLIDVSGGRATAEAIPGAELEVIEGMGHDLPQDLWPRIADGIERTAARAAVR